jgi:hypothetical protein
LRPTLGDPGFETGAKQRRIDAVHNVRAGCADGGLGRTSSIGASRIARPIESEPLVVR